jgi:3-hydroxy-5-methyl-1-naphthoate 3-O-methyltransferase
MLGPDTRPYFRAAAVAAAHEIGLFAALPCPAADLPRRLGVAPHRLAALADVLVLEGALRRAGDELAAGDVPPHAPLARAGWGRLAEVLRGGRPLDPHAGDPDGPRRYHEHLLAAGAAAARELGARLPAGRFLDAGGGAGAFTAGYLDAHPGADATLADLPAVLPLAERALAGRARLVAADLLGDDLGGGYDVIVAANLLHLYGPATCGALVVRLAGALAPGGRLAVVDLARDTAAGAYFALNMALYTDEGTVHDVAAIRGWLAAAGLADAGTIALAAAPDYRVVVGHARVPGE